MSLEQHASVLSSQGRCCQREGCPALLNQSRACKRVQSMEAPESKGGRREDTGMKACASFLPWCFTLSVVSSTTLSVAFIRGRVAMKARR